MTKAKAKILIAELLDAGLNPRISETAGNYTITVEIPIPGASLNAVQGVETTVGGITAKVIGVQFN